jgi:imidazolonepropionase
MSVILMDSPARLPEQTTHGLIVLTLTDLATQPDIFAKGKNRMLIHSANQILTLAGGPQRGSRLGELGIISDGAVLIQEDKIVAVGDRNTLLQAYPYEPRLDVRGKVVLPGFVDPHTHAIWAGDRAAEFEQRLMGKTYLEILQAGGGILSTMRATRAASVQELIDETQPRLRQMMTFGTTTIEVKTGYGLELHSELDMLAALVALDEAGPAELVFTFLGAHAIPPEFQDDGDGYTEHLCADMLPAVHAWWQQNVPGRSLPFVDVFCETGAFSLAQTEKIFQAASRLGYPLKVHADEFDNLGGAALAARFGAISADHLVATSLEDIQKLALSDTVAVALPCTPFGLAHAHYTPARAILEANGYLALATDLNPGTAWCESMQFAIALACRYMKLTPAQAIAAATINAAAAVGRANLVGSLEPGKQADLIVLDVPDYRHLGYRFGTNLVQAVMKRGKLYPGT